VIRRVFAARNLTFDDRDQLVRWGDDLVQEMIARPAIEWSIDANTVGGESDPIADVNLPTSVVVSRTAWSLRPRRRCARRDAHRRRVLSRRGVRIVLEQRRETLRRSNSWARQSRSDRPAHRPARRPVECSCCSARAPPDPSRSRAPPRRGRPWRVHGLTARDEHTNAERAKDATDAFAHDDCDDRGRGGASSSSSGCTATPLATQRSSMICSVRSVTRMSRGRPASIAARRRRRCCRCECDSCRGRRRRR